MVDPDGEFWHLIAGAAINVITHWDDIKKGNFWDFMGYAGIGAVGAQLGTYGGGTFLNNFMWGSVEG